MVLSLVSIPLLTLVIPVHRQRRIPNVHHSSELIYSYTGRSGKPFACLFLLSQIPLSGSSNWFLDIIFLLVIFQSQCVK